MSAHVDSVKTYSFVFLALIACTVITTLVAYVDLGPFSVVVALAIAATKMMLVALFFMHLRHSSKMTKLVVVGALLWLFLLIFFAEGDYISRAWMGVPGK